MEAVRGLACQAQCASTKPQVAKVSKNRRSKSNFVQCAATAFSKFSKIRLIAQDILARCHSARSSLRPERWRSPLPHASYHRPSNPGYETGLDLSKKMVDVRSNIFVKYMNYSPHPPDDQVNQRPALAQFLCLKNIRLFLASCTKYHHHHHHHHYYHKYSLGNSSKQATISGSTTCGKPICSSRRCFTTTQTLPK